MTRGDLTLRGSRILGAVKVVGARLTGDLSLIGTSLDHAEGAALAADGVKIAGDVDLRAASITGETSLIGARVNGDVKLDGGTFESPGAIAMTLNRAVIDGALFLRGGVTIDGALSLNGTQVGTIVDEPASWPKAGDLLLNRFRYGGFVGSPVDARTRLDWLSRQAPERWGEDFWPQPYEQLSIVLDQMGHRDDARKILFEKDATATADAADAGQSASTRCPSAEGCPAPGDGRCAPIGRRIRGPGWVTPPSALSMCRELRGLLLACWRSPASPGL